VHPARTNPTMKQPLALGELGAAAAPPPGLRVLPVGVDLGLSVIELVQSAGEVVESPAPQITLVNPRDAGARVCCDFGAGRFRRVVRAQDLFLGAAGHANAVQIADAHGVRAVTLRLDPELPRDFGALHAGAFPSDALRVLLDQLWAAWDDAQPLASCLQLEGLRLLLLAELLRLAGRSSAAPRRGLAGAPLRRVLDYLHAHYAQDIRIGDLAAIAGLSPFHFARSFRCATQQTPGRFQARLRVEQAAKMLREGRLSVLEVALAVGFGSTQALARPFRARHGQSPSAYRRQFR